MRRPRHQARRVPAASQHDDELGARRHLLRAQEQRGALVRKQDRLGGDDVEVRIDSESVPVQLQRERPLCRSDGRVLLPPLLREDSQRGKEVLHLLERGQHGLPVARDLTLIRRERLLDLRLPPPPVEQDPRERRAERPDPGRQRCAVGIFAVRSSFSSVSRTASVKVPPTSTPRKAT